ncbi:MAG: hypothetical protein M1816_003758 [Peltula sp. TS41687]|nr:MAG: hypothetical protein M1816_003758 [Peltula sp. TS41687]
MHIVVGFLYAADLEQHMNMSFPYHRPSFNYHCDDATSGHHGIDSRSMVSRHAWDFIGLSTGGSVAITPNWFVAQIWYRYSSSAGETRCELESSKGSVTNPDRLVFPYD